MMFFDGLRKRPSRDDGPRGLTLSMFTRFRDSRMWDAIEKPLFRYDNRRMRQYDWFSALAPGDNSFAYAGQPIKQIGLVKDILKQLLRSLAEHDGRQLRSNRALRAYAKPCLSEQPNTAQRSDSIAANCNVAWHEDRL